MPTWPTAPTAIVIIYADNFSDIDLRPLLDFHRGHDDPFTMVLFRAPDPRACGIAELDAEGRIVSFVEKPDEPTSDLANAGVYVVDATPIARSPRWGHLTLDSRSCPGSSAGCAAGSGGAIIWTSALTRRSSGPGAMHPGLPGSAAAANGERRPAVFLDRDGTLIEHVHYLSDPAHVRLLPGAAEALAAAPRCRVRLRRW